MAKDDAVDRSVLVADESFAVRFEGADHHFAKDITRVRAGHPILKGVEHLFRPVDAHYDYEAATSAPNEKRGA
jgi:hypothetical protein